MKSIIRTGVSLDVIFYSNELKIIYRKSYF